MAQHLGGDAFHPIEGTGGLGLKGLVGNPVEGGLGKFILEGIDIAHVEGGFGPEYLLFAHGLQLNA